MHPRDLNFKCDWVEDSELEEEEYPEDLVYNEDIDGEDFGDNEEEFVWTFNWSHHWP